MSPSTTPRISPPEDPAGIVTMDLLQAARALMRAMQARWRAKTN